MAGFLYKYTTARLLGPHQQDLPVSSYLARLTGDGELEIAKNDLTRSRNNYIGTTLSRLAGSIKGKP